MKKLAIITTHPIQYNAPWFRLLANRGKVIIRVFYTWGQVGTEKKYDPGFVRNIEWDIPLTDGYEHTFVKNSSSQPGSHHFRGIENPSLIKEVEAWQPDAILVFGWSFKSHLKVIRHFKGKKPVLFRGDSTLLDEERNALKKIARRLFLKWVYWHVDFALYVGQANKKYFLHMGLKEDQLVFAPHSIDNERFEEGNCIIRERFGISQDAVVLLYSGKLEDKKDPTLLLDSFIALKDNKAHLMIVGDGKLMRGLKEKVAHLDKNDGERIHFAGFVNQSAMPSIYHASDIFVLPSKGPGETWGLSVNEAMAAGCAIIVSDKCGCYLDLVKEEENGFVFQSENLEELISLMKRMVSEKNRLKEMGEASKKMIKGYSFEIICEVIENLMETKVNR